MLRFYLSSRAHEIAVDLEHQVDWHIGFFLELLRSQRRKVERVSAWKAEALHLVRLGAVKRILTTSSLLNEPALVEGLVLSFHGKLGGLVI